jgi:hypothetical protein
VNLDVSFFSVRVDHGGVSFDELWDEWEKEVDAAQAALEAGKIKHLYKVSGQRRWSASSTSTR